jgi:putative cell wall-binding protein
MRRRAAGRAVALLAALSLAVTALVTAGPDADPGVAEPLEPAAGSQVVWNGRAQAPCPEGQTRVSQAMAENFGVLPQERFNRGFYLVSSSLGGRAARSLVEPGGSTRDHLFLNWTRVTPGARTMLGFATRGSTPGGYYATLDVNSRSIQVTVGSTTWSGRVYDITTATDDEGGDLGTWLEHRSVRSGRTWWDIDNLQVYTCRNAPVSRLSGPDRYATSARISSRFAPGVEVAYLVSGSGFPDGISASAPAAAQDGPVLLVRSDTIPPSVRTELTRLRPSRIVVVGGSGAVGDAVLTQAQAYATSGQVDRLAGPDRYGTSAEVARTFPSGGAVAYVATGAAYPDALTGSALAGHRDAPLLLTRRDQLPDSVREALTELAPASIVVLGGSGSVSPAVEAELATLATTGSVSRIAGANRYATAALVAAQFPTVVPRVYVAAGTNFPDALAGSALAGSQGVPLLLSASTTVPDVTLSRLGAMDAASAVLLGGDLALQPIVMDRVGGRVG